MHSGISKLARVNLLLAAVAAVGSSQVLAGPYAEHLGQCMVKSTTPDDKHLLVKWLFATASLHPVVAPIASITEIQRQELMKSMAAVFQKLLTESCRTEAQAAVRFEGRETIGASFKILGQVAGQELFSSPEVAKGMASIDNYIDKQKIESLFKANK